MDEHPTTTTVAQRPLTCQECERAWLDPVERWRLYVDSDEPRRTVAYCQACAEREFGHN
jgi:hypothetical protein